MARKAEAYMKSKGLAEQAFFGAEAEFFVFDVIDTWIWYKTENEIESLRQRPHPFEFAMYYDM